MKLKRDDFPHDFLFGSATSAYQIEGHQYGGAGRTHWDDFAQTPGNVVGGQTGARACEHYHRYGEDFDLVAQAGFDAYRFSVSWARVQPNGQGALNPQGLDFYDRLVDALVERDIKPCLTLYHWELPSALADLGGWRNRDIADRFADYTDAVMRRIGDRVWGTAPINEPWCVAWLSHFVGAHAPGLRDIRATARAMHHVLLAHGRAIQAMRALGCNNLGAIFNFEWAIPADASTQSESAAALYDAHYNRFFVEGVFHKKYPALLMPALEPHLPTGWQDDFDTIGSPVDWCGVNYYTCARVAASDGLWPGFKETEGTLPKTQMGWEIYPDALYELLKRTAREHTGDLPIYVTENGMAAADVLTNGEVNDEERGAYIDAHLAKVQQAISDGVPVKGYYIWSLLDNYEWALGYEKRFGLVHVDFDSMKRTPKRSYYQVQGMLTTR